MILIAVLISWLLGKPIAIRPVWISKVNTALQIAFAAMCSARTPSAIRDHPARHHGLGGGRLDAGLGRGLYRAMARSYEPVGNIALARSLAAVALLVPDYDAAIAWFRDALGFELVEDVDLGGGKRWVVVAREPGRRRASGARQGRRSAPARGDRPSRRRPRRLFPRDRRFRPRPAGFQARGVAFLESAAPRTLWDRRRLRRSLGRQVGPD